MNPKFIYRIVDAIGFLTSRLIMPFTKWLNVTIIVEKMAYQSLFPVFDKQHRIFL